LLWLNVAGGLDVALLSKFRESFASDAKNQLAQNVCVKHDLLDVLRVSQLELTPHVYNHKVTLTVGYISVEDNGAPCPIQFTSL